MVGDFLYVVERAWTEQKMGLIFMLRGDTLYRFAYYSILTFFKVWIEPNKYDVDSNSFVFCWISKDLDLLNWEMFQISWLIFGLAFTFGKLRRRSRTQCPVSWENIGSHLHSGRVPPVSLLLGFFPVAEPLANSISFQPFSCYISGWPKKASEV